MVVQVIALFLRSDVSSVIRFEHYSLAKKISECSVSLMTELSLYERINIWNWVNLQLVSKVKIVAHFSRSLAFL